MSKFGDAFAAARKSGKKEFTFGGERYNTRMSDEKSAKPAVKPSAKTVEKPAAKPTAAPAAAPGRVGMENFNPKLANIKSGIARGLSGVDKGIEALGTPMTNAEKARQANIAAQASKVAAAKKDYDPSSAGSNFKMAMAKMGFKKGGVVKQVPSANSMGSLGMAKGGGIERKGKTKGTMVKMAKGGSIDGIAIRGKTRCKGMK